MIKDLHARKPVNKMAAFALARGTEWAPAFKKIDINESDFPIRTVDIPECTKTNPNFQDLTGRKHGRLIILGLAESNGKRAAWVCRCGCGRYVVRNEKAILNPENYGDRCRHCKALAYIKKKHAWEAYGNQLDVRDI